MKTIQRFRSALVTGKHDDNPESLMRDPEGDYVLYADHIKALQKPKKADAIIYLSRPGEWVILENDGEDISKTLATCSTKELGVALCVGMKWTYEIED